MQHFIKRGDITMDKKSLAVQKIRDFYAMKRNAPIYQLEFGYFVWDKWKAEGHVTDDTDINQLFGFDENGRAGLWSLGWCEAAFCPVFDEEVLEERGKYELVRDFAGRHVLCFKGRRQGFMPEYVEHPVKDWATWERDVKWRLAADAGGRFDKVAEGLDGAREMIGLGAMVIQHVVGGYMYLRSLAGPEGILYMVYDQPDLVHDMMKSWFELADAVIARHQREVTLDELFLAEDICYNHGPLISPDMMRSFLFPYYQQLITNIKNRQLDKSRHLYIQIDTDGDCRPVIPVYQEIGMDYMSPFEVASGCDVVALRKQYPGLLMRGGFDKRILASGRESIRREVERIMPFMKERGGYIPCSDHGVPEEVPFEDYMYYRELMRAYQG
jgi:uroporphyrinogen decarboxylase